MIRRMLLLGAAGVWISGAAVRADDCTACKTMAETGSGYCEKCGHGKAFGVDVSSKKLYDTLAGMEVKNVDEVKCPGCQRALKTNGKCTECNVAAANKHFYKSMAAHAMAKGEHVPADKAPTCPECKKAHASGGWCTACKVGFVSGRQYKTEADFEAAQKAHQIILRASRMATKCEGCGVAVALDGTCEKCNIAYLDGKPKKG